MCWRGIVDAYMWSWTVVDHRIDGWLFMSSIKPILVIVTMYCILSAIGPKLMKNRPSVNCVPLVIFYCCVVVCINIYIDVHFIVGGRRLKYNWICDDLNDSSLNENITKYVHLYMMLKIIELMDSVFTILLKIKHQPNAFFIFHHSSMVFISWTIARWSPGGSAVMMGIANTTAHVVTYIYMGCYVVGPEFRKKMIVRLARLLCGIVQMIQYCVIFGLSMNGILNECRYNHFIFYMMLSYIPALAIITFLVYFFNKSMKRYIANEMGYLLKGITADKVD